LGDIFCCSDTQYNTNQRAVSTVHMPVNDYLVPLLTCTLTDAIVCLDTMLIRCCLLNTIIVIIIEFWNFFGHCYALHKYRYWYWVLVSLEANIIGYWILGAFLGIVLTLVTTYRPVTIVGRCYHSQLLLISIAILAEKVSVIPQEIYHCRHRYCSKACDNVINELSILCGDTDLQIMCFVKSPVRTKSNSNSNSKDSKSASKSIHFKSKSSKNGLKSGLESKSGLKHYKSAIYLSIYLPILHKTSQLSIGA